MDIPLPEEAMYGYSFPICNKCKHLTPDGCPAFPGGRLPDIMFRDGYVHDRIIPGQVGDYVFEPIEKK